MRNYCDVNVLVYYINKDEEDYIFYAKREVACPVYAEDRGEFWGSPCSQDVIDIDVAESELYDMKKELEADGMFIVATKIDGEYESEATYDEIRAELEMPTLSDEDIDKMIDNAGGDYF